MVALTNKEKAKLNDKIAELANGKARYKQAFCTVLRNLGFTGQETHRMCRHAENCDFESIAEEVKGRLK